MTAEPAAPASPTPNDPLLDGLRAMLPGGGHEVEPYGPDLERALLQLQKLETLGRLTTEIAHDFSNLMTIVLGYEELFEAVAPPDLPGRPYLDELRLAAERASALTRQLLDFSRQAGGRVEPVDLAGVVRDAAAMLGRVFGPSVELEVAAVPGGGLTRADPRQVEQVVVNLLLNARDAAPVGGRIEVSVAAVRLPGPLTHELGTAPPGEYLRLRVRDDGPGIEPQARPHLFRPFYTTKAKGTGLGLVIVARVVRQCGGAITVDGVSGRGATFDVYFPRLAG